MTIKHDFDCVGSPPPGPEAGVNPFDDPSKKPDISPKSENLDNAKNDTKPFQVSEKVKAPSDGLFKKDR